MSFTRAQRNALAQLAELWSEHQFVLIGASALQVHLPLNRNTRDLDISLAVDLDEFPAGLGDLAGWKQTPEREHAWLGPGDVRVDVLPAGPKVTAVGYVQWPSGSRMNMVGFRHVFEHTTEIEVSDGGVVRVAQPHVIALLKTIAYLDRPAERGRDLADIAFLLEHYVDDDDGRRWSDEVLTAGPDFEDVPSYLLGRDLGALLSSTERAVVLTFLDTVTDPQTIGRMVRQAPPSWHRHEDTPSKRIAAFRRGLDT
jgi:predicted nucleotidyltransferase